MGIPSLLPLMKPAVEKINLKKLEGQVAAIDTNGWIHRACYNCGDKLYMNQPTDFYVRYCLNYCERLRGFDIVPVLVFDGQDLPAKEVTREARRKRKEAVRANIEDLLSMGDTRKARELMRTCVDVTFEMTNEVIKKATENGIDCIVAPYEADAQIAYMVNNGMADFAITEDSDMLVFGCKRTLYKLNKEDGKGEMIDLDKLTKCFTGFNHRLFQLMCVTAGCDYLVNLPGIAMGRAKKYWSSLKCNAIDEKRIHDKEFIGNLLKEMVKFLKMNGKTSVTDDYVDGFVRALATFDHQIVFCPKRMQLVNKLPIEQDVADKLKLADYAGKHFADTSEEVKDPTEFILHFVKGNVHAKTLQLIEKELSIANEWFGFGKRIEQLGEIGDVVKEDNYEVVEDEKIIKKKRTSMVKYIEKVNDELITEKMVEKSEAYKLVEKLGNNIVRSSWSKTDSEHILEVHRHPSSEKEDDQKSVTPKLTKRVLIENEDDPDSIAFTMVDEKSNSSANSSTFTSSSSREVFRVSKTSTPRSSQRIKYFQEHKDTPDPRRVHMHLVDTPDPHKVMKPVLATSAVNSKRKIPTETKVSPAKRLNATR